VGSCSSQSWLGGDFLDRRHGQSHQPKGWNKVKHIWTITQLSGYNRSQSGGDFIEDANREFVTKGVIIGISVLWNKSTDLSSFVTNVTANRIDAVGVNFKCGDPYIVTLNTPWTMQTSDGPLIEVECNLCGFSYPNKELSLGRCKTCQDELKRI
jgi:hypothetical protein